MDSNGLTNRATQIVSFKNDGDGTYSYTSEFSLLQCREIGSDYEWDSTQTAEFDIVDGHLILGPDTATQKAGSGFTTVFDIKKISQEKFITVHKNGTHSHMNCKKTDIVPELPELPGETSLTRDGRAVTISWEDTSNNETGFVLKRAVLSSDYLRDYGVTGQYYFDSPNYKNWEELVTIDANVTSYVDTLSDTTAQYYYRVYAKNAQGLSVGSNIVSTEYFDQAGCIKIGLTAQGYPVGSCGKAP